MHGVALIIYDSDSSVTSVVEGVPLDGYAGALERQCELASLLLTLEPYGYYLSAQFTHGLHGLGVPYGPVLRYAHLETLYLHG